ncbi:MAG: sensor histidine kinase [bacterium]|nr:sensor histidine kinase [bacterium]
MPVASINGISLASIPYVRCTAKASLQRLLWVSRICALLVLTGGAISAVGWIAGIPGLADWDNNAISTKFNASLCLMFAGLAVLLAAYHPRYKVVVRILGGCTALIGAATLSQFVLGVNYGIDTLFFGDVPGAMATASPGRMGPPAAASFALVGTALILCTFARTRHDAATISLVVLTIASISLAGYIFGASALYTLPLATGIAMQTAIMVGLAAVGLAAAIPERGLIAALLRRDGGGLVLRSALPVILIGLFAFTWLLLSGVKGGFYDASFGAAIGIVFEIILFTGVLWWTAGQISENEKLAMVSLKHSAASETRKRIAETQESERKRIARDLHDQLGQEVTGIRFALERICGANLDKPAMIAEIKAVCQKMKLLDSEVSSIAWQLRPPEIADGLVPALRNLGGECSAIHNIAFDLYAPADLPALTADVEGNIFRIVQEAMNNVVKHSGASRIGLLLDRVNGDVRLAIEDDGNGNWNGDEIHERGGFGLIGMRERAALIGGDLQVEASPGNGTTILCKFPAQ